MAGLEPILPTREIVGLEGGKKQFQKWHGIRIKMGACRSWSSRHFGISIALPIGTGKTSEPVFLIMHDLKNEGLVRPKYQLADIS